MTPSEREYVALRRRLRAARLEAGLTQVEAARRMGWPQSYISKIESGERRVDAVELWRLARVYERPLSYFFK